MERLASEWAKVADGRVFGRWTSVTCLERERFSSAAGLDRRSRHQATNHRREPIRGRSQWRRQTQAPARVEPWIFGLGLSQSPWQVLAGVRTRTQKTRHHEYRGKTRENRPILDDRQLFEKDTVNLSGAGPQFLG